VDFTGTVIAKRFQMHFGTITLMHLERVFGEFFRIFHHHGIAAFLGDNTGGRNGAGTGITLDNSQMLDRETFNGEPVNEAEIDMIELLDGLFHRQVCGIEDIEGIYLHGFDNADTPGYLRMGLYSGEKCLTAGGGELFRIIDSFGKLDPGREDNCRGDDGTGERTPPGFVDAGDSLVAALKGLLFKKERPLLFEVKELRLPQNSVSAGFFDTGGFTDLIAQIVELGALNNTATLDSDAFNSRGMERKYALYAMVAYQLSEQLRQQHRKD